MYGKRDWDKMVATVMRKTKPWEYGTERLGWEGMCEKILKFKFEEKINWRVNGHFCHYNWFRDISIEISGHWLQLSCGPQPVSLYF